MGTRELRKAWPSITARWEMPLALATTIYCSPIWARILPRVTREVEPMLAADRATAGRIRERIPRSRPLVGSRWSHSAKTVMRNRASQNPGTDSSRVDRALSTVSSHVPRQATMSTPPPTPNTTATARAARDTFSVMGRRRISSWAMSWLPV